MFEIVKKKVLAPSIQLFEIAAPEIAAKAKPGQFVIVRVDEKGERIPLTIADFDRDKGTITIIFQIVGLTTTKMGQMKEGDWLTDLVGPLGVPSEIGNFGTVICVGGGVGIAPLYPITRALKQAGNRIVSVIGSKDAENLILRTEMSMVSDDLIVTTQDGSLGIKGLVTDVLKNLLSVHVDRVVAIGPVPMMKAVSDLTLRFKVKTIVSMNPIMLDGTGMCGACRVLVDGESKFACVHGPEFDGHKVNWEMALIRANMFKNEERMAMNVFHEGGNCRCHAK